MALLKHHTVKDLKQWLAQDELWGRPEWPISYARASSLAHNPRAQHDSVVFLTAWEANKLLGHMSVLTDTLYYQGEEFPVAWMGSWWAKTGHKGIGRHILLAATEVLQRRIICMEMSAAARHVAVSTGDFHADYKIPGTKYFFQIALGDKIKKRAKLPNWTAPLSVSADLIESNMSNARGQIWQKFRPLADSIRLDYVPTLDPLAAKFIENFSQGTLMRRAAAEIHWSYQYPWLMPAPLIKQTRNRTFFGDYALSRSQYLIRVTENEKLIGIIFLKLQNGQLTVPYLFAEAGDMDKMALIIVHHAIQCNARDLLIYREDLSRALLRQKMPLVYKKQVSRGLTFQKGLPDIPQVACILQDGDGDCVFW